METEIVDGMEIVYGDEIEISATKHISLSSVAYDIPEFVGESEGTEDMTDETEFSLRPFLNYWKKRCIHQRKLQFFNLVIIIGTIYYPKLEDYWAQY